MSQSEFFDWLLETGTGWLGWTEQQTLDTSMPAIVRAHEGRVKMLRAIFGGSDDESAEIPTPSPPVSAEQVRNVLRAFAR